MKNNQNSHRDMHQPDEHPNQNAVEIAQPEKIMKTLDTIIYAVGHDQAVTERMMNELHDALNTVMVRIGDREMTLQQFRADSNAKIWKEILNGDFKNTAEMTVLTDAVAQALIHYDDPVITLPGIACITNEQAKSLSRFRGGSLFLEGLTRITDAQAEDLGKMVGNWLCLGIAEITDRQAESLAAFGGQNLEFNHLRHITDTQAYALATFRGKYLILNNLEYITDKSAENLAPIMAKIQCNDAVSKQLIDAASRLGLT